MISPKKALFSLSIISDLTVLKILTELSDTLAKVSDHHLVLIFK